MFNTKAFTKFLNKRKLKKLLKSKFVKYVIIASLTTLINVLVYLISYHLITKSIIISNILAYTSSIYLSFTLNEKVVYKCKKRKHKKQIPLFLGSKVLSFFIDSLVLLCLDKYFALASILEKLIANASTTLSNYFICDKIIFKEEKTILPNLK